MKTESEIKFDKIIKYGFHELLKPLGFKKKAYNFYLQLDSIGQIINVQKSVLGNKDFISFTLNIGIFVPQYYSAYLNDSFKGLPDYPTEPDCLIRKRIGKLRNQNDTWYEVNENTNEQHLVTEMRMNIVEFILPFFERINSNNKMLKELEITDKGSLPPLGKLIVYGEFSELDKAKLEYEYFLKTVEIPIFFKTVKEYGEKYGLDKL